MLESVVEWNTCFFTLKELGMMSCTSKGVHAAVSARMKQRWKAAYTLLQTQLAMGIRASPDTYRLQDLTLTSEQWSVYYAFWFLRAVSTSWASTLTVTPSGVLSRYVILRLSSNGMVLELPSSDGWVVIDSILDGVLLRMHMVDGAMESVAVHSQFGCSSRLVLPYDVCVMKRAFDTMYKSRELLWLQADEWASAVAYTLF